MSKNVAVFVDVANIFYAAKAAGVDIDYVTLLKAATAGRDFVRAYAYTGLDPENENQRQFHSFLARNNYKVISKDIRKYGDGRIKANLDIELVVDMMKTARNLDIAVVVSGDGDFASAIRAVQEMGVRVEVISFRGNTSSDLIEAADIFIDIAQIARVDKSGRSGRRVAAEGDLSMTEVPEKETEGVPRRRRGRGARDERDERPQVAETDDKTAANIVVLPGERLSRAPDGESDEDIEQSDDAGFAASDGNTEIGEDGRRRRRRRGGRGRGRGRRPEDEGLVAVGEPSALNGTDEDEEFDELPPAQPPVHAFGSVWDSQLGVPSASMPAAVDLGGIDSDDEDFDEPEVPEYLLAERRQRAGQRQGAGRGRAPGGRNRSAYQAALDRERYGRSAPPPSFGGGAGNNVNRAPDRNRDRGRQGRPQQGRPVDRGPRVHDRQMMSEPRGSSSEPWSEVPPELEQMLRAELARKQGGGAQSVSEVSVVEVAAVSTEPLGAMSEAAGVEEANGSATPTKPTRRRTTKKAPSEPAEQPASEASATQNGTEPAQSDAQSETPARTRATRTRSASGAATQSTSEAKPAAASRKSTRSASKTTAAADSSGAAADPEATAPAAEAKKPTRRRTTKSAAPAEEA